MKMFPLVLLLMDLVDIFPVEDRKDINTHLFKLRKKVEGGYNGWSPSYYSYYYLGIGYTNYFGKNYFFRIRVDRFYIKHQYHTYDFGVNMPIYSEYYKSTISTMQYTGGIGKKISWKFLDFLPGIETLLHYIGDKEVTNYIIITDTSGTNSYYSYTFDRGGNFMGLSLLGAVNINLRPRIGIGIEASAGIAGWNKLDFIFHYPSLSLCYNFDASERAVLFRNRGATSP